MNLNLTLFGQMIAFVCFVWFCMRYVWPPIMAAMTEREKKIADGLAAADRANHDLELAKEKSVERMKEAKEEAAGIIDAANKRANQLIEEAKEAAVVEADRVKASARAEIEQETNRAREALRSEVVQLSLVGAEKVLQRSVDREAHRELVEKLAAEL